MPERGHEAIRPVRENRTEGVLRRPKSLIRPLGSDLKRATATKLGKTVLPVPAKQTVKPGVMLVYEMSREGQKARLKSVRAGR